MYGGVAGVSSKAAWSLISRFGFAVAANRCAPVVAEKAQVMTCCQPGAAGVR